MLSLQDSRSPFLRLPPELRDWIYRNALTEPEGLYFEPDAKGNLRLQTAKLPGICANQLKYVNRQLHRETRGLGVRFNDLTFITSIDAVHVIRTLSRADLKALRVLYIKRGFRTDVAEDSLCICSSIDAEDMEYVAELFSICRDSPHITIRFSHELLHLRGCVIAIFTLEVALRRQSFLPQKLMTDTQDLARVSSTMNGVTRRGALYEMFRHIPDNFRFWWGPFDEQTFRKSCKDTTHRMGVLTTDMLTRVDGGIEHWIKVFRELCERGL